MAQQFYSWLHTQERCKHVHTKTGVYKTDRWGESAVWHRELSLVLCGEPEGWIGQGARSERNGNMYVRMYVGV